MNLEGETNRAFVGYEYKEITVHPSAASMYIDCYASFGWAVDKNAASFCGSDRAEEKGPGEKYLGRRQTVIRLKRDRKLINKVELTRLQRHFEACINEQRALERAKKQAAGVAALTVGIAGTAFMAGSVFAVTNEPPMIGLCILLAVPGFAGWILPYFLHGAIVRKKTQKQQPIIQAELDEIYRICEKGHSLL